MTQTPAYNQKFANLGYDSRNILTNMGSIMLLLALIVLRVLLSILIAACRCRKCQKKRELKWINANLVFRFMLEAILEISICAILGIGFKKAVEEQGQQENDLNESGE